ncbi:MAG: flavin-containing monooxygenase [Acidimicrobiia bacterium]
MTQVEDPTMQGRAAETGRFDAVVVGAGFAGLYLLHRLRAMGLSAIAFDAASDVGGTWFWNRYPGARCDIVSIDYSFSFDEELEQEWTWSEKYATQPEILAYANHVADRFDLRRDIRFSTRVLAAEWVESEARWSVRTDRGDAVTAPFLFMAVGALSSARRPDIEGIDDFAGEIHHTGQWPHEGVRFAGRRVAVIGTGSSGIQSIPHIAAEADHLTVFQRTPCFTVPARNRPLDDAEVAEVKARYRERRAAQRESHGGTITPTPEQSAHEVDEAERLRRFDAIWEQGTLFGFLGAFNDVLVDEEANAVVADYLRERIRRIVDDPTTADALCPTTYPVGTKRLCLDTDYYETFNRPNVELVDLRRTPIERITTTGIETSDGTSDVDVIVFATGFDAMTGALLGPEIVGRNGRTLRDEWSAGPRTYLGLTTHGFPNMFMICAPGSPSVMTNMLVSIEQHVEWSTELVAWMGHHDHRAVDPALEAQDAWVDHVNEVAGYTLFPKGNSWYLGANVPGKPRVFMPYLAGVAVYRSICDDVAEADYRGFEFTD